MKHLIFSALVGIIPQKEKQKEPVIFKPAFVIDDRKTKIVKTILDINGNVVDTNYKGLVYLIYDDFTIKKEIFS